MAEVTEVAIAARMHANVTMAVAVCHGELTVKPTLSLKDFTSWFISITFRLHSSSTSFCTFSGTSSGAASSDGSASERGGWVDEWERARCRV